jgi:hypothetical protein
MRLSPLSPETLSSPIPLSFSLVYPMVWRRVEGAVAVGEEEQAVAVERNNRSGGGVA